jgi:hypothetical protein
MPCRANWLRILLIILFLIVAQFTLGQNKPNEYIEVTFSLPWKTARISLTTGNAHIYTFTTDSTTILAYDDLGPGYYKLSATSNENLSEYRDSILVEAGQKITANIVLSKLCDYDYPKAIVPACPAGHKDNIVEIRYRNEKNRLPGTKYFLVTYTATGCIPRYYCTLHEFKF